MGTGVTKSLAAGKESEDLGTDKAGGRQCRQGRGYTDGEWGSGAGSLHRETRTGHPRPRALQINHIGPCVEKSFHRCSHFTSRTTNQTSQDGKASLPPPPALRSPPQHFRRTQDSLGSCLPHQLPGLPKEASVTHLLLQLTHFLLEEHFHVLQNHFHLLHPLFSCFQLFFMCFLNKRRLEINTVHFKKNHLRLIYFRMEIS